MSLRSIKVSKEQLAILVSERAKPQHARLSWTEMCEILNNTGPSVKNENQWLAVNIEAFTLYFTNAHITLY